MSHKIEEMLNDQIGGTLNTTDTNELRTVKQIFDTPFAMIENDAKHFVVLGKYRLTEPHENVQEILQMIDEKDWKFLINLMWAICMDFKEANETQLQTLIEKTVAEGINKANEIPF